MPDWYGIVPTIFSDASSMIQYCFGYDPMISVPLPAETRGLSDFCADVVRPANTARTTIAAAAASFLMTGHSSLREDQIDLAPILLRGRALRGPVGRVIELVRDLRRPVAADVAVEQVAFDRLAQPSGPARLICLPTRREHERAADREVRHGRRGRALEGYDVRFCRALDARGLAIDGLEMIHSVLFFLLALGPHPRRVTDADAAGDSVCAFHFSIC